MSDLLSPILHVMAEEGHAYVSFCALMSRMKPNFFPDGKIMMKKFDHLSKGLLYYDTSFFLYLKKCAADDLLFCYRWLLLEMKREFNYEEACLALEVIWSSLPPHADMSSESGESCLGVSLFEHKFTPKEPPPKSSVSGKREAVFTSIVNVRKRLSTNDLTRPRNRISSDSGVASSSSRDSPTCSRSISKKNKDSLKQSKSLVHSLTDREQRKYSQRFNSVYESSAGNKDSVEGSSPPEERDKPRKRIKNLNEFYKLNKTTEKTIIPSRATDENSRKGEENEGDESQDDGDDDSNDDPFKGCDFMKVKMEHLPPPTEFGAGNPFLMFVAIAAILQHRNQIVDQR